MELRLAIGNEIFFYLAILIAVSNALVFVMNNVYARRPISGPGFMACVALNFFFVVALNFISLYNSGDEFDYARSNFLSLEALGFSLYGPWDGPYTAFLKVLVLNH